MRLARLEVQRKQWAVTEVKQRWMETLQGIQLERALAAERRASVASNDALCLRQLDAFAQVIGTPKQAALRTKKGVSPTARAPNVRHNRAPHTPRPPGLLRAQRSLRFPPDAFVGGTVLQR